jgi:hypothetical protein
MYHKPHLSQVQRGLYAGNASSNNQYVPVHE